LPETSTYGQFCPVAMAAEILCSRWTMLLLREMLCGSTRFNDLRRGLPRMSPTLLSKRLKELELSGVIRTVPNDAGITEYHLTEAGEELRPIVTGIGFWGQRWVESRLSLRNLDPSLLMWDMRRNLNADPLPPRRCTIQFLYPELPEGVRNWWLVVSDGKVDLCQSDPGFEVDGIHPPQRRGRRPPGSARRRPGGETVDASLAEAQPLRPGRAESGVSGRHGMRFVRSNPPEPNLTKSLMIATNHMKYMTKTPSARAGTVTPPPPDPTFPAPLRLLPAPPPGGPRPSRPRPGTSAPSGGSP
jgi:DNA-binding HxlR family transcriptional regulator